MANPKATDNAERHSFGVTDWIEIAGTLDPGSSIGYASSDDLAEILWQYGEDDLERYVRGGLTDGEMRRIAIEAGRLKREKTSLAQALARAALTVLVGEHRDLARKRRRNRASR
jgi:hypothetical protein